MPLRLRLEQLARDASPKGQQELQLGCEPLGGIACEAPEELRARSRWAADPPLPFVVAEGI